VKLKRILATAIASVLIGSEAFALSNSYGWPAAENAALFNSFKTYMKVVQSELAGEPAYFMAQELLIECEATFKTDPYAWLGQVSRFCNFLENIYGPAMSHPRSISADRYARIRKAILMLRDYPMHEMSVDDEIDYPTAQATAFNKMNTQWLNLKRDEFFQFLDSPRPTGNELQIVKLYSSGVVFRTKNGCIGIDMAYEEAFGNKIGVDKLADQLDALFVTHPHGDHYDATLVKSMLNKKKPVVMPSNLVSTSTGYEVIWSSSKTTHAKIGGVASAAAIMSGQGDTPCLLYHIEMDGWRFIHVGDNSHHENEPGLKDWDMADVVMSPVFQGLTTLFTNIDGASNPDDAQQFYLNIHENEFHHIVDRRVSYKYMFSNAASLGNTFTTYPCVLLLDCGEHITLTK